jgi:hypothetical protein
MIGIFIYTKKERNKSPPFLLLKGANHAKQFYLVVKILINVVKITPKKVK